MVPLNAFFYETPLFLGRRHIAHLVVLLGTLRFMANDRPIFLDIPDCKLEVNWLGCPNLAAFRCLKAKQKISRKSDAPRREFFEAGLSWADYKTNQPFIKQAIMYLTIWINIIHANIIYVKYILKLLCTIFSSSKSSHQKCTYICSTFFQDLEYPIFLLPLMKE